MRTHSGEEAGPPHGSRPLTGAGRRSVSPCRPPAPGKFAAGLLVTALAAGSGLPADGTQPDPLGPGVGGAYTQTASSPDGNDPAKAGAYSARPVPPPRPQARGHWGEWMAASPDLDADKVPDLLVGVPFQGRGAVYALSGRALAGGKAGVILALEPPEQFPRFGFAISSPGDVDGDRVSDIAAGEGKVWVFSGKSGGLVRTYEDPQPQTAGRFGSRVGRGGDVNGDGISEVIVGAPGKDVPPGCSAGPAGATDCRAEEGLAFVFDGANGALVRTLNLPAEDRPAGVCASACGSFGLSVQGPGDADGDGVTDHLVSAPSYENRGRIYLFSGKTGDLLRRIDPPQPQAGASFGFQDAAPLAPGDVNGDGRADLYANGFLQDGPAGTGQGRAWVFSGADGALLYTLDDPSPTAGGQFGWSMTATRFDGDSTPDLYIGSSPHHVPQRIQNGGTYVFDGKDGKPLQALELPRAYAQAAAGANLGPNLGWSVAAPGDLNGDRRPDLLAGAPYTDRGQSVDEGVVFAFLSGSEERSQKGESARSTGRFPAAVVAGLGVAAALLAAGVIWGKRRKTRNQERL